MMATPYLLVLAYLAPRYTPADFRLGPHRSVYRSQDRRACIGGEEYHVLHYCSSFFYNREAHMVKGDVKSTVPSH